MNLSYLLQGLALGFAAGILPGPVMMFAISQVIKKGAWAGVKVQFGATAMDIIRIIVTIFLFSYLPQNKLLIGSIAFVGGLFLLYMAYGNFIFKPEFDVSEAIVTKPVLQGMLGNILNAAAYVFWLTVGGPIILAANISGSRWAVLLFAIGFLVTITGIGTAVALLADRAKHYLSSKYYVYTIRALGLVLIVFATLFFKQAYHYLII